MLAPSESAYSPRREIGSGLFRFDAATCCIGFNLPNFVSEFSIKFDASGQITDMVPALPEVAEPAGQNPGGLFVLRLRAVR
jgi:hypothetical protein